MCFICTSKFTQIVARLFIEMLELRAPFPRLDAQKAEWGGASDASIRPGHVGIGGWISNKDDPSKDQVWWFYEEIREKDFPFLFYEDENIFILVNFNQF